MTVSSVGFCTSTHVSKEPLESEPVLPSARYQLVPGVVTPIESCAAWRYTPVVVLQYMALSAITALSDTTLVETLHSFGTKSATLRVSRVCGARVILCPVTSPAGVW